MMKKLNQLFAGLFIMLIGATLIVSCGEDGGPDVCQIADFEGTWIGKYAILGGLLELPNKDTLTITFNGNTASISSKLLGGTTFMADYDPETGDIVIENLNIPMIAFGSESFSDITVESGEITLRSSCSKLFLTLEQLYVGDGTVDIPNVENDYPLGPTTLQTAGSGFIKQ